MMRVGAKRGPVVGGRAAGESAVGTLLLLALLSVVAFAATYSVISALHGSTSAGGAAGEPLLKDETTGVEVRQPPRLRHKSQGTPPLASQVTGQESQSERSEGRARLRGGWRA